jgi:HSP20 family protein
LDRLFEETPLARGSTSVRSPALDVAESDGHYSVTMDIPGVSKEEVSITIDGRHVNVSAQAKRDVHGEGVAAEGKEVPRVIWRERSSTTYARSFTLPEEVDQDRSQAKLEHGVLTLTLEKKRAAGAKPLTIN